MSYPINYPTPQDCDVQIFYGRGMNVNGQAPLQVFDWVKPRGASFVWFTLIGGGGSALSNGSAGGGSGSVTNCLMPAFLVPDELQVRTFSSSSISVMYQGPKTSNGYTLLSSESGGQGALAVAGLGGAATARTAFAAAGLYQSVAGQDGADNAAVPASATTFLSGGTSSSSIGAVTPNYGYPASIVASGAGFFQLSPIIVGRGGATNSAGVGQPGGVGCGGGGSIGSGDAGGLGGPSMAVIVSW